MVAFTFALAGRVEAFASFGLVQHRGLGTTWRLATFTVGLKTLVVGSRTSVVIRLVVTPLGIQLVIDPLDNRLFVIELEFGVA